MGVTGNMSDSGGRNTVESEVKMEDVVTGIYLGGCMRSMRQRKAKVEFLDGKNGHIL